MPKVSVEYEQQQRSRIVAGAALAFAQQGFHQTKIDDIAAQLGISKGAIYSYFDSKEALFEAAFEDYAARRLNALRNSYLPTDPTITKLDKMLDSFTDALVRADQIFAGLWIEFWLAVPKFEGIGRLASRQQQTMHAMLYEVLQEGRERGEVRPGLDLDSITTVILATCDGLMLTTLTGYQAANALEIRRALRNTYANLLCPNAKLI